ncbi:MAG: hypothetical protein ACXVBU_15735, partial [Ktedonobacteraceae bacterium]
HKLLAFFHGRDGKPFFLSPFSLKIQSAVDGVPFGTNFQVKSFDPCKIMAFQSFQIEECMLYFSDSLPFLMEINVIAISGQHSYAVAVSEVEPGSIMYRCPYPDVEMVPRF